MWNEVCDLLKEGRRIADFKAGLAKGEGVKCRCSNSILCVLKEM